MPTSISELLISRRSLFVAVCWLMVIGLSVNMIWLTTYAQQAPAQATSSRGELLAARTPYTVVLRDATRSESGAVTLHGEQTIALRADGTYVERWEYAGGQSALIQRFIYLPSGVDIVVDDVRELRTTTLRRAGTLSRARVDSSRSCVANSLGEILFPGTVVATSELVDGYRTVKVNSGQSTFWFALQLGCAKLRSTTQLPDGVMSEKAPISITAGVPDDSLFFVPTRYEEVQYSTFYKIAPNSQEGLRLDRTYFARRPPR